jgi:C4-dicarboxylate-specific signal transduction histidine kinase
VGNLVDNALDAVSGTADPWVQVALMQVDGSVRVAVRDSGPGVPGELAEEIFRRGVTTKDGQDGRGIGLALVHLVCARRDGFITVSNDDGAVFVASLPERVEMRP